MRGINSEGVIRVSDAFADRRETFSSMTGAKDADVVIQGFFSVTDMVAADSPGRKTFEKIISRVRFVPSFLFAEYSDEPFRIWGPGGFRPVRPEGVLPDISGETHLLMEIGRKAEV